MFLVCFSTTGLQMAPNLAQHHGRDRGCDPSRQQESSAYCHPDQAIAGRRALESHRRILQDEIACPYRHYVAEWFSLPHKGQAERLDLKYGNDRVQFSNRKN